MWYFFQASRTFADHPIFLQNYVI